MSQSESRPSQSLSSGALKCEKCGAVASQRDINGDWWPPCGCGIQHLKFPEASPSEGPSPSAYSSLPEVITDDGVVCEFCGHPEEAHDDRSLSCSAEGCVACKAGPVREKTVLQFATYLSQNYDEVQREHIVEIAEEFLAASPSSLGSLPTEEQVLADQEARILSRIDALHPASGSPPELKKLLASFEHFAGRDLFQEARTEERDRRIWLLPKIELPELTAARSAIEVAFASLTEERDAARIAWREWKLTAEEYEREILGNAAKLASLEEERDRLRRFETYVCQVIAMGNQADLTVEALPR